MVELKPQSGTIQSFLNDGSKKIFQLNNISNAKLNTIEQNDNSYKSERNFALYQYNKFLKFETELNGENILSKTLLGDKWTVHFIKFVQARRHKKKRINKKWLKRYGYKEVITQSDWWDVKFISDRNIEIIKEY